MRAAISEVAEEIRRQVTKRRDKTRNHRKSGTPTIRRPDSIDAPAPAEGSSIRRAAGRALCLACGVPPGRVLKAP